MKRSEYAVFAQRSILDAKGLDQTCSPHDGQRASRLAAIIWVSAVFSEFMGSFNVLHQPLTLSVVAWSFWAVAAVAEALAIVYALERRSRNVKEVHRRTAA